MTLLSDGDLDMAGPENMCLFFARASSLAGVSPAATLAQVQCHATSAVMLVEGPVSRLVCIFKSACNPPGPCPRHSAVGVPAPLASAPGRATLGAHVDVTCACQRHDQDGRAIEQEGATAASSLHPAYQGNKMVQALHVEVQRSQGLAAAAR